MRGDVGDAATNLQSAYGAREGYPLRKQCARKVTAAERLYRLIEDSMTGMDDVLNDHLNR